MNSPERMPAETHKPFTGYLWGTLAVLTCPLPPVHPRCRAGRHNRRCIPCRVLGHHGARFDRPVSSVTGAGVAGIQGKIMSASRPDGWTTAEGPSVRARARLSVRKADAGGGIRRLRQSMEGATMNANDPTATSCCVCCKEIPLDAAFTPEGAEYVEHFCGLECYQRFQARASTATETSGEPNACGSPPSN